MAVLLTDAHFAAETGFPFGLAVDFFPAIHRSGVIGVIVVDGGALLYRPRVSYCLWAIKIYRSLTISSSP
jgi:hypothetical protein